ncbi:DUF4124 domain-containing protein [Alteromonas gracilis]|uniref:DUF4124 domain-containing protein n=1 Tax=Alteromonas gracilis TaxID=1479524 RepID=UPI0037360A0F
MLRITRHICLISLLLGTGSAFVHAQAVAQNQAGSAQNAQAYEEEKKASAATSRPPSSAPPAQPKVYKVVSEDGTVTYTDKPQLNAEPLTFDVKTQNVVTADKVPPPPPPTPKVSKPNYKVVIKSPAPEATIRNNLGEITISAAQTGAPKAPIYRLIFDDAPIASNSSGVFKLSGIHRGAHTYKVELTNNTGKTLASSPVQTLYLHQASALINN